MESRSFRDLVVPARRPSVCHARDVAVDNGMLRLEREHAHSTRSYGRVCAPDRQVSKQTAMDGYSCMENEDNLFSDESADSATCTSSQGMYGKIQVAFCSCAAERLLWAFLLHDENSVWYPDDDDDQIFSEDSFITDEHIARRLPAHSILRWSRRFQSLPSGACVRLLNLNKSSHTLDAEVSSGCLSHQKSFLFALQNEDRECSSKDLLVVEFSSMY
ncbi:hypothetical protein AXG93_3137s1110 [Marchantia polymorpha subsp. ruderalis]|uniref:Uncharacterized protein n=1 Tax=Marchantia polymorpha subsp. ruderalis TaxID=1480154 RepID=A0A176W4X9_MARPO|nr:hypothetical protein AXG93_3137s1110 [Marchantia polymorpha subsp. ruderalis]